MPNGAAAVVGANVASMSARLPGPAAPARSLEQARGDQHVERRGDGTQERGRREPHHADHEDPAAAEAVAEAPPMRSSAERGSR